MTDEMEAQISFVHVEAVIQRTFDWLVSSDGAGTLIVVRRHLLDAEVILEGVKNRAVFDWSIKLTRFEPRKRSMWFTTKSGNIRKIVIVRRRNNPVMPSDGFGILVAWDDDDLLSRANCDPTQTIVVPIKTED